MTNHQTLSNPGLNQHIVDSTDIPNSIFDYWMRRLTGAQFKVLHVLFRHTLCSEPYGQDGIFAIPITRQEIAELAGVGVNAVSRALKVLVDELQIAEVYDAAGNSLRTANVRRGAASPGRGLVYLANLNTVDPRHSDER